MNIIGSQFKSMEQINHPLEKLTEVSNKPSGFVNRWFFTEKYFKMQMMKIDEYINWIRCRNNLYTIVAVTTYFRNWVMNNQKLIFNLGKQNILVDKLFEIVSTIVTQDSDKIPSEHEKSSVFKDFNVAAEYNIIENFGVSDYKPFCAEKPIIQNIQSILTILGFDPDLFISREMDTAHDDLFAASLLQTDIDDH